MVSYALEGPVWQSGPITWSFADTNYAVDQPRPFSGYLSPGEYQDTVVQAVERWALVSGLALQQVPDSAEPATAADIRIGFGAFDTATTRQVGETAYRSGSSFTPDVLIRLEDPAELPVDSLDGRLIYEDTGGTTVYQVALHELGHALGLGHSSAPDDVMYPTITTLNPDLSLSDIAGIRALYAPEGTMLQGAHTDYLIAEVAGGQAYIQDTTPGRDGTQILANPGPIKFADGSGLFDPTGTAEDVTRLYEAAFGRVPDIQSLENDTAAVTSGTMGIGALAASFVGSPEAAGLYGQTDVGAFVRQLYQNIRHQPPDAAGQRFWEDVATTTSRGDALLAFSDSEESRRQTLTIAGSRTDAEVTRLYQAAFGHAPDGAGLSLWSSQLKAGATGDQVAQSLLGSGEFAEPYGPLDDEAFVTRLYANALGRAPDAAGAQGWLDEMAGGASRAQVLAGFADSDATHIATAGATHDAWVFVG